MYPNPMQSQFPCDCPFPFPLDVYYRGSDIPKPYIPLCMVGCEFLEAVAMNGDFRYAVVGVLKVALSENAEEIKGFFRGYTKIT